MKEFTVYLDDELHERLSAQAFTCGMTKAAYVRGALNAVFDGKSEIALNPTRGYRLKTQREKRAAANLEAERRDPNGAKAVAEMEALTLGHQAVLPGENPAAIPTAPEGLREQIVNELPLKGVKYQKGRNWQKLKKP